MASASARKHLDYQCLMLICGMDRRNVMWSNAPTVEQPVIWQRFLVLLFGVLVAVSVAFTPVSAQQDDDPAGTRYTIQPGDKLQVAVWNEPDLQKEILVAPDGSIAFPLVGELSVVGKSIDQLRQEISERLSKYIAEPIVTVTIQEVLGNKVYVIGQVNRPGQFVVNPMVDVMQALSMAGGTTPYASLNNITILRRRGDRQISIPFKFGDVSSGKNLNSNIVLQSGDVVIVP